MELLWFPVNKIDWFEWRDYAFTFNKQHEAHTRNTLSRGEYKTRTVSQCSVVAPETRVPQQLPLVASLNPRNHWWPLIITLLNATLLPMYNND